MSAHRDRDEPLDRVFEEAGVDPGLELGELVRKARRGRAELSEEASCELLERVLVVMPGPPLRRVPPATWAAGLVATLALMAVFWTGERTEAPAAGVVVKEVFFESVHEGKTARLEMVLERISRPE